KITINKTTSLPLTTSISRSPLPLASLLIPLPLACFALSSIAQAVEPSPDGSYPNGNTSEGTDALYSLTTGIENTAIGLDALYSTNASGNTATGAYALATDDTGYQNTANGLEALYDHTTGYDNTTNA